MADARVVVGLSGGVDSSVAALLLQQQGLAVEAVFMKNWEEDDDAGYCAAAADLADARQVCERLGIPLRTVNFAAEYWDFVFSEFLDEYRAGRTPNPDVMCNQEIKFKAFLDFALAGGADAIATGHYARVAVRDGRRCLLRGVDRDKDQSYFLYRLGQAQLERARFPLGGLDKPEVRRLAERHGLITHAKKDSTGICFIGERPFREFLAAYLPAAPGPIVDDRGAEIGRHDGLIFYTLGQRRGLGIGGRRDAAEAAWYVAGKDPANNVLTVVQGHDHPLLFSARLSAVRLNWISGAAPRDLPLSCTAQIRYRQADQACRITAIDADRCAVEFPVPQRAATPGQSIVFYLGEECLGGGIIDSLTPAA